LYKEENMLKKVAVYTAIYGGHDGLKQPPLQDIPCDFICFTDNQELAESDNGLWRVILVERPPDHPRMQAKYFRMMSHQVFPNGCLARRYRQSVKPALKRTRYDFIIWIDGSCQIKSPSFAREACACVKANKWAMFYHPDRNCIYDEMLISIRMEKYEGLPLIEQVASYRGAGYPKNAGLWATGVIVRRGRIPRKLKTINEEWLAENQNWSYQDQLSLPYLLWKNKVGIDIIHRNLWNNEWMDWIVHNSAK
jgi:hypothetical protein